MRTLCQSLAVLILIACTVYAKEDAAAADAKLNLGTPVTRVLIEKPKEALSAEQLAERLSQLEAALGELEPVEKLSSASSEAGLELFIQLKPKKKLRKADVEKALKPLAADVKEFGERELDPRGRLKPARLDPKTLEGIKREDLLVVGRTWLQQVTEARHGQPVTVRLERCTLTAADEKSFTCSRTILDSEWAETPGTETTLSADTSDRIRGKQSTEKLETHFGSVKTEKLDKANGGGISQKINGKSSTLHLSSLTWRLAESQFVLKYIDTKVTRTAGEEDHTDVTTTEVLEIYE